MFIRYRGSSFIEVLVALMLLSVFIVGLATTQLRFHQRSQQYQWQQRALHWANAFAELYIVNQITPVESTDVCFSTTAASDCDAQSCTLWDAHQQQIASFCQSMQQQLNDAEVLLEPCQNSSCIKIKPREVTWAECEMCAAAPLTTEAL